MSAFEKLPREIRDHIYEHCLVYDGEIDPFPDKPLWEHAEHPWRHERLVFGDFSIGAFAIENKPCVALLSVNSKIRDEAASTLFGKNTWRLSAGTFAEDGKHCLWETWWEKYAQYFRHLVTSFDFQDADQVGLLDVAMGEMERPSEDSDHFDPAGTANIHQARLNLMEDGFIAKKNILLQMELKTLSIDLRYLTCRTQCCRREAIQMLLLHLGSTGPWYRLEQERGRERDTKPRTDVKLLGLKNDEEEKLFWDTWGYKAE